MITSLLPVVQMILAVALVGLVLLQKGDVGLGEAFGSSGSDITFSTRRGLEKILFNGTIILSILFIFAGILAVII